MTDHDLERPSLALALSGAGVDLEHPTGALALRLALDLDAVVDGPECSQCGRGFDADPRIVARFLDVLAALGILTPEADPAPQTSPLAHLRAVSDDRRRT